MRLQIIVILLLISALLISSFGTVSAKATNSTVQASSNTPVATVTTISVPQYGTVGKAYALVGSVKTTAGVPVGVGQVDLYAKTESAGGWVLPPYIAPRFLKTINVDKDGSFFTTDVVPATKDGTDACMLFYQAKFRGATALSAWGKPGVQYAPSSSADSSYPPTSTNTVITVKCATTLDASVSSNGRGNTISGTLKDQSGIAVRDTVFDRPVPVGIWKKTSAMGSWVFWKTVTVDRSGKWSADDKMPSPLVWYRAKYAGDDLIYWPSESKVMFGGQTSVPNMLTSSPTPTP
ncbi:MAG: hypothetical protein ACXV2B_06375, partial [Halobacteriota archaeon]